VRLLLDAHVSGRSVGRPLGAHGHDVRALGQEPWNEGLDDDQVLDLATADRRILVTHDVRTVPGLLRAWAEAGRPHGGVILVHGVRHDEFGRLIRGILALLDERPRQADWVDRVSILSRRA
jgi:predicted nuclease of predicted toxin-antitoxin system